MTTDTRSQQRTRRVPAVRGAAWAWMVVVLAGAAAVVGPVRSAALSLLGYRVFVVESGSMEPALGVGDAIIVRDLHGDGRGSIRAGDIVTFAVDGGTFGTVTHRVVSVLDSPDGEQYLTKGDANRAADSSPVSRDRIVGEVVARVPHLGAVSRAISGPSALFVVTAMCGASVLVGGVRTARRRAVPKGRQQPPREGSTA